MFFGSFHHKKPDKTWLGLYGTVYTSTYVCEWYSCSAKEIPISLTANPCNMYTRYRT
jgi:hypothetical protein